MTSLEYLDLAAEITYLQRDLVEEIRRGVKLDYCDFAVRIRILTMQFLECIVLAGAGHEAKELHDIYWKLAEGRIHGKHSAG